MIHGITIRRFKQFEEVTFRLNGMNMVLAGRNTTGKTTILQAIAAWSLAIRHCQKT
jgi:predicted ATP-dependent endonuclease of OLD family